MSDIYQKFVWSVLVILLVACAAPAETVSQVVMPEISIARHPGPVNYSRLYTYTEPPVYAPYSTEQWQVDLRSSNLTKLDLSKSKDDLLYADFDSKTHWPADNFYRGSTPRETITS
jgi:hypothetical protein